MYTNTFPESGGLLLHNLILVIDAENRDSANEFCNSIGAEGETFSVGLYDQNEVLSGYWCGWNVTIEQEEAIASNQMFQIFDTPQEALDATGWHITQPNQEHTEE